MPSGTHKCRECEEAFQKGNIHFINKKVCELSKKKSSAAPTLLDKHGLPITDFEARRKRWKEHFIEKLKPTITPDPNILLSFPLPQYPVDPSPPPLRDEVLSAIKSLKINKAPGPGGIQSELLKAGPEELVDIYHKVITSVWKTGHFPRSWAKATIVPLFKKGEKGDCNNYRPISLTSQTAKILTKILLDRLKSLTNHILGEYQASFRKDRSTIDQIFSTRQMMEKYIEFAKELLLLFIDSKQAFDLIWRNGLWHTLLHYGVPENIVILIRDMYSHFVSQVQTPEGLTEGFLTSADVLQGCLLSPHLFNLFLNAALSFAETADGAEIGGKLIDKLAFADDIEKFNSQEHLL